MNNCRPRKVFFLFIPFIAALFLFAFTWAVHGLWNAVIPEVFGLKAITFWQAMGLLVLAKIFFGGWPGRRGRQCGPGRWRGAMKKKKFAERWQAMTPEEKEKWRSEIRSRFGDWPRAPWWDDEDEAPPERKNPDGPESA